MLATVASILILACWTVSFAHWRLRGGRLWYFPLAPAGRIAFTLGQLAVLAASVMVLVGIVGANALMSSFAVAAMMDVIYSCWRREHELAGETKVA
jgi:hypothetical protein